MTENEVKKIFGTDGVRGKANHYPMTVELALALGRAAGKLFRVHSGKHRVVIGKDTRLSCYMFENALIAGLCSMGIDTLMVGPLPTPGVAFITRAYRADAGIVISASHNSFEDNGIKFFSAEGFKFDDEWERQMEHLISTEDFDNDLPQDRDIGKNTKIDDADGRYIEFAKGTFPRQQSLQGLKICLDCSNGAGYRVAPMIFRELDADVIVEGNYPNGLNINLDCGSLHPEVVQKLVQKHKADVGIALDGDADRVIMVDEKGEIVDGDAILAICAKYLHEKGELRNGKVVSTVMSNFGFVKSMENLGIEVVQAKVGDRHVIQEMLDQDINLGGEQSGHIIFSDFNTTGDGLVAALQVLRIMVEKKVRLSELASVMKRYPQVLLNVPVQLKPALDTLENVSESIAAVEKKLGDSGRVLVRYSGTENICRVMVEGADLKEVKDMAELIATKIKEKIGA
ncbi:MAG: phosphoglucosamine mutase [Chlamydiota bacterium]|nr:phosphoglucosamine mutase [Chlamydiota bacterium]